jgi:hypothetical protein
MTLVRLIAALLLFAPLAVHAQPAHPKIVLIAGDDSLPVFDNAVHDMEARLRGPGVKIERLSTSRAVIRNAQMRGTRPEPIRSASLSHVLAAISNMHPAPGQGCFVFATSHGAHHVGLWLSLYDEYLTPRALDAALVKGCGDAPTAVVISSCYSGSFARAPMARANRVILTAARADRSSFGCGAGRSYTVFDKCMIDAFDADSTWHQVFLDARRCVSVEELAEQETPSEPQGFFGADLPLPK